MNATTMEQQARLSLQRLLPRLEAQYAAPAGPEAWGAFRARLDAHFGALFAAVLPLYGGQYDFFSPLESMLSMAARMWLARPAELQALDARREAEPRWFQAEQMMGGVCYVDRFAGTLAGVREHLPYFKE